MFKEILKIIPRLENKDLQGMENSLNRRFARVARRFGRGLRNVVSGGLLKGGMIGLGLGLINKILNPLKETQDALEKILTMSDDLVTNAAHFKTSSGNMVALNAMAQASGLETSDLYNMMSRFQIEVSKAKEDPNYASPTRQFTQFEDIGEGFFRFIQSLQKMDSAAQIVVQEKVFGSRQILKLAEFMQKDFRKLKNDLGLMNGFAYTKSVEGLAEANDLKDLLAAKRTLNDFQTKGSIVNKGMIGDISRAEDERLKRENDRIRAFQDLQAIQITSDKIAALLEQLLAGIGKLINWVAKIANKADSVDKVLGGSRALKGHTKGDE